jgi:hypothetical protein
MNSKRRLSPAATRKDSRTAESIRMTKVRTQPELRPASGVEKMR